MGYNCNHPRSSAPAGLWTLHTSEGRNIQLHFLDFDVEMSFDVVEVRDGVGSNSRLLGEDVIYPQSPLIGPPHVRGTSHTMNLSLCFQLSSPEAKALPMTCTQQQIRCQCGSLRTHLVTAMGSVQTLPLA